MTRSLRIRAGILAAAALLGAGASAATQAPPPREGLPPEGRLLLQLAGRVEVLDAARGRMVVGRGIQGYDLSGTGRQMIGTVERPQPDSGASLHTELVLVDTSTGARRTLLQADPKSSIGEPAFSADGSRVAFTLSTWRADAALDTEGPAREVLCVTGLAPDTTRCYRGLGSVLSFDWSPEGDRLVTGGPGDQPVYVVDAATERVSVLLPPGGTDSVRAALGRLRGFGDRADQFIAPQWSDDRSYVAVAASVTPGGWVPVVVDGAGEYVALGETNPHGLQAISWSPAAPRLAHTTGYNGAGPPGVTFGVHVLDVTSGETRLLHSTNDRPQPAILDVAWSPSGRWLALDHALTLEIVDTWQDEEPYTIDVGHDDPDDVPETLQDWGP